MTGDGLSLLQFASRIGLNLSALLTIGFALHAAAGVVERNGFQPLRLRVTLPAVAVTLFAGLRFGILIAQMSDGTSILDPDLAPLAWTALGASTVLVLAGAAAAVLGVWLGSRLTAALGAMALSAGFGLTGHSQGLADPGLAPLMVAAHVLVAGFWVAAPFSLYPGKSMDDGRLLARLARFSAIAMAAIPILIALGVWLAWLLTGSFAKLLGTTYGLLLLGKLAIGLLAMGLGGLNKLLITARIGSQPATGRAWLRITLLLEASLFVAAIIAVSAATTIGGPSE